MSGDSSDLSRDHAEAMLEEARSAAQTRRLLYLLNATYTPEGVRVWLDHAEKQGWPLDERVRRAEALLGQVAT